MPPLLPRPRWTASTWCAPTPAGSPMPLPRCMPTRLSPLCLDQADFHRIAQAEHLRLKINLHHPSQAFLGQELQMGKAGADHQQRVAIAHQLPASLGAAQTDRTSHPRQVVRQHRLAEQRLCYVCTRFFSATAMTSSVACRAPAPTRMATFLPSLGTSAAFRRSDSRGTTLGALQPIPECSVPWARGGSA